MEQKNTAEKERGAAYMRSLIGGNIKSFFRERISIGILVSVIASGFIIASLYAVSAVSKVEEAGKVTFESTKFLKYVPRAEFIMVLGAVSVILFALCALLNSEKPSAWTLAVSSVAFSSVLASVASEDIYLNAGLFFVLMLVFIYLTKSEDRLGIDRIKISGRVGFLITVIGAITFAVVVGIYSSFQYLTYTDATFDFGIFAQMFDQMAKTGLPFTTIERGELLSHFAVHFSPIYYIALPGYMIFRTPLYLYAVQAAVVALGAIPVYLICRKLSLSPLYSTVLSFVYLMFPTMAGGCFYDFHENKFLSVLVLFLIYFILDERIPWMLVFALGVLLVKEDAAIYVGTIALWTILSRNGKKMKIAGVGMLALAVVYFFFATNMIAAAGGSPMISRLSDYYNSVDGDGFGAVVKTIFYDIGYLVKMCFTATYGSEPAAAKIVFLLWVLLPLVFTPFMNDRVSTFILLVPMGVINLMQSWPYQYDIGFQYTYGSVALLIVMAVLALSSMSEERKRWLTVSALAVTVVFGVSVFSPSADYYSEYYFNHEDSFTEVSAMLDDYRDEFEGSSVTASDYFTPHLYYVDDLHALYYYTHGGAKPLTEYYVVHSDYLKNTPMDFIEENYDLVDEIRFLRIYKLSNDAEGK